MVPEELLCRFYKYLTDGKASSIRQLFIGTIAIDTPLSGSQNGEDGLQILIENEGSWMRRHLISVEMVGQIKDEWRIGVELKLLIKINGEKIDLPVILIGDLCNDKFGQIRIYHSTWPINGEYKYRAPLVWPHQYKTLPDVIDQFFLTILEGDYERVPGLFTEEATLQEPGGTRFIHKGHKELKSFYSNFLSDGSHRITRSVSISSDNIHCIEYICDTRGEMHIKPLAGCSVYETTPEKDKIKSIRIYNDIRIPKEEYLEFPG